MPKPRANETEQEFVSRCIPIVLDDGTAQDNEQAAAVCYSMWETGRKGADMADRPREHKTIAAFSRIENAKQGIVKHYVAVMGNIDLGGDVIHPGAFSKTLAERGNKLRVIDQHNTDSIMRVIGKPLSAREVGRAELPPEIMMLYPEANGALEMQTQYLLNTPEGDGAFKRIDAKAIDEYSIGYDPIVFDYEKRMVNGEEKTIRNLRELKLWEYGPVIFGMNPATMTVDSKSDDKDKDSKTTEPPTEDKAGRRVRAQKLELIKQMRGLLDEFERWADYNDEEETAPAEAGREEDTKAVEAGPVAPPTLERERERLKLQISMLEV